MTPITYFILGVVVGGVVVLVIRYRGNRSFRLRQDDERGKVGLIERQQGEKAAHKQAIISAFAEKGRLTNDELQSLLGVSSSTVVRYMDELEKEGKVRQVGPTGQNVYYERV
jgi:predicted HTH transcriptional regulator